MHESTPLGEYLKVGYFVGIPIFWIYLRYVEMKSPQNVVGLLSLVILWPILLLGYTFDPIGKLIKEWEI